MQIAIEATEIAGVVVVVTDPYRDSRGLFEEIYRADQYGSAGLPTSFVQLNRSRSVRNVTRGLHFQWDPPMGKLMYVTRGEAFLVAVDIRPDSPTLGKWLAFTLSEESNRRIYAPAGFARGFCVLSDWAEIEYLCTGTYNKAAESGILWNDPEIGVKWPVSDPIVSPKDRDANPLSAWLGRPEANLLSISGTAP